MPKSYQQEIFFPQIPLHKNAIKDFEFTPNTLSSWNFLFFEDSRSFRLTAYKINSVRKKKSKTQECHYAKPSDINATALINTIYRRLFAYFEEKIAPSIRKDITTHFKENFPPSVQTALINEIKSVFPYLQNDTITDSISDIWIRSLIIRLNNENPALLTYQDLFCDKELLKNINFANFIAGFNKFFDAFPKVSGKDYSRSFLKFLREPFRRFPNSLYDQLLFIKEQWSFIVGDLLDQLLLALDLLKEENKPVFNGFGPPQAPDYGLLNDEYEAFSDDKNWMPNVVMLAKSTLVWLDQLSKKYHKHIQYLHQIPTEELELIHSRGFTAIWLIGIWERSKASKRIKHIYGNYSAEASAYSLFDYEIADNLGGWPALEDLRKRCQQVGLRLASDMVPNHTSIDSKWVIERPDLFLQLPYNPMPYYSFNGEDLCERQEIGIFLEDKYYSKSDCAVVFKRVNYHTGEERYIYHGNDGTGLPWNDTAQLNYLNPETREAVIQTILHVAQNFSIIRFDAAMTLAKKHIQRLWFPAPGQGGDIPTRSEHAISTAKFNEAIPKEFWREVVDRIAKEAPDTLLLAEAFWMLEGYFVRTLGMHRVYNSAFMHMLRDEHNQKFRNLIKETLEFDPQILKRYVNFMNNPDEETAAEQFGKGDKYFGICMFLCTIPGLPMIGHGQIEGFYEKYGMEFKTAQWNEQPDEEFIARHEKEIFPLMRERHLYSEVINFRLYNFDTSPGVTNENVYAYSNRNDDKNVLIVFNNSYHATAGIIKTGVPYKDKATNRHNIPGLGEFLQAVSPYPVKSKHKVFVVFTEQKSGLDYIREYSDIWDNGLFCIVGGYQYQIFKNFIAYPDQDGSLEEMAKLLNGGGIESLLFEAKLLKFKNAHKPFNAIFNPTLFSQKPNIDFSAFILEAQNQNEFPLLAKKAPLIAKELEPKFKVLSSLCEEIYKKKNHIDNSLTSFIKREMAMNASILYHIWSYFFIKTIQDIDINLTYDLALIDFVQHIIRQSNFEKAQVLSFIEQLQIELLIEKDSLQNDEFFKIVGVKKLLNLNLFNNIVWFDVPPFEILLVLQFVTALYYEYTCSKKITGQNALKQFDEYYQHLLNSDYQLYRFLETLTD